MLRCVTPRQHAPLSRSRGGNSLDDDPSSFGFHPSSITPGDRQEDSDNYAVGCLRRNTVERVWFYLIAAHFTCSAVPDRFSRKTRSMAATLLRPSLKVRFPSLLTPDRRPGRSNTRLPVPAIISSSSGKTTSRHPLHHSCMEHVFAGGRMILPCVSCMNGPAEAAHLPLQSPRFPKSDLRGPGGIISRARTPPREIFAHTPEQSGTICLLR